MVCYIMRIMRTSIFTTTFLFFSLAFLSIGFVDAAQRERITDFMSNITIDQNSSMTIKESIIVESTGDQIRRGIVREFPTRYKDRLGNNYVVDFTLENVTMDGESVPYRVENLSNGNYIYIGDSNKLLPSGKHTFELIYKTNRQLGFFKNHDELFWNATGNGWRLPIDRASASVTLPENIPLDAIQVEAYTGFQDELGQDFTTAIQPDGIVVFKTTKPLQAYQGLTIVVGWPKGFVHEPDWIQKGTFFLQDNWSFVIFFIGFILLILFYFLVYFKFGTIQRPGTIIPLFHPPEDLSPSQMRYVIKKGFDTIALTAEIVHMAVHGLFVIKQDKEHFFSKVNYRLIKRKDSPKEKHNTTTLNIYRTLFSSSDEISLQSPQTASRMSAAKKMLQVSLQFYCDKFINTNASYSFCAWFFLCVMVIPILLQFGIGNIFGWIVFGICALLNVLFGYVIRTYTPEGQALKDKIDGFKLFLETTESDRLKIIGTPPTKTPELYEQYLPYAIALGVEQQWAKQFIPVFAALKKTGNVYVPIWYRGQASTFFYTSQFASTFSKSFTSSIIASSLRPPGSSSGFGGRNGSSGSGFGGGGSGRGGGGGGGGGW